MGGGKKRGEGVKAWCSPSSQYPLEEERGGKGGFKKKKKGEKKRRKEGWDRLYLLRYRITGHMGGGGKGPMGGEKSVGWGAVPVNFFITPVDADDAWRHREGEESVGGKRKKQN